MDSRLDGDIPNDRSDRDPREHANGHLSHEDSGHSDTELNNLPDYSTLDWRELKFKLHLQQPGPESFLGAQTSTLIPQSESPAAVQGQSSLQKEGSSTLPKEVMSRETTVDPVFIYIETYHQQFFQQLPGHQQLQHQVNPISFLTAPLHSSMSTHAPLPPMRTPAQKASLQASLEHLSKEPNPEEIEEIEQMQESAETFKNMETELDVRMGGDLPNAMQDRNTGGETDKISDKNCCDLEKEITDDSDMMYRIQQDPLLQSDQGAFTLNSKKLSSEAFVHTVSEPTAAQQQYRQHIQEQPRHQQVRFHVTPPPSLAPLSRSLLYKHGPQSLMSTVARKPPSQMTLGRTSTERIPEKIKKIEQIQKSVLYFKKQRTELDPRKDGDARSFKSNASTSRNTDDKTSDVTRHESDKKNKIVASYHLRSGRKFTSRITATFSAASNCYTQERTRDELNELSQEYSMHEVLSKWSIYRIETQRYTTDRMLGLKPLLELWLESKRKVHYSG